MNKNSSCFLKHIVKKNKATDWEKIFPYPICCSYSIPTYLCKRKEGVYPSKDLYMNAHSSFIYNS